MSVVGASICFFISSVILFRAKNLINLRVYTLFLYIMNVGLSINFHVVALPNKQSKRVLHSLQFFFLFLFGCLLLDDL